MKIKKFIKLVSIFLGDRANCKSSHQIHICGSSLRILSFNCFLFQAKTPACSCVDCEDSCPVPKPLPPLPQPFTLLGCDGYIVTMVIIFVCGSAVFMMLMYCFGNRKQIGKSHKFHRLTFCTWNISRNFFSLEMIIFSWDSSTFFNYWTNNFWDLFYYFNFFSPLD